MIDAGKCEYEEGFRDEDLGIDVFYFIYPKDLSETEFYPEEDYGVVVSMCISLTIFDGGDIMLQMSPSIQEEDRLVDVDWRDLFDGENYTDTTIELLLDKTRKRLLDDEYNALNKISRATKMDCWFSLDSVNGVDYVYDCENGVRMSLRKGISQLVDGMVEPVEDEFYRLSDCEVRAFNILLQRMNVKNDEVTTR